MEEQSNNYNFINLQQALEKIDRYNNDLTEYRTSDLYNSNYIDKDLINEY